MKRKAFQISDLRLVSPAVPVLHHVGALVRLRSGGPVGVVTARDVDDNLRVVWLGDQMAISVLPEVCLMSAVA